MFACNAQDTTSVEMERFTVKPSPTFSRMQWDTNPVEKVGYYGTLTQTVFIQSAITITLVLKMQSASSNNKKMCMKNGYLQWGFKIQKKNYKFYFAFLYYTILFRPRWQQEQQH